MRHENELLATVRHQQLWRSGPCLGYVQRREEMAALGLRYVEPEGMQDRNLWEVWESREALRAKCDELGLTAITFCPMISDLVSIGPQKWHRAIETEFALAIHIADRFACDSIQTGSCTAPFEFIRDQPYRHVIISPLQNRVMIPPEFNWQQQWGVVVDTVARSSRVAREAELPFCLAPGGEDDLQH